MQLAFHGATTITASLEADIRNSQQAGYTALEIWTEKLDAFLEQLAERLVRAPEEVAQRVV